jgi:hypothetical protein
MDGWCLFLRDAVEVDMAAVCDLYNAHIPMTTAAWTGSLFHSGSGLGALT